MNFQPDNLLKHFPGLYLIGEMFPYMMEPYKVDQHSNSLFAFDFGCRLAYRLITRKIEVSMAVSNKTIPEACPFYYYEVILEELGSGGYIQIGFIDNVIKGKLLSREESICVGIEYQNHSYKHTDKKIPTLNCFASDTVGVGIDFMTKTFYIVHNGVLMNSFPIKVSTTSLKPAITISSPGCQLFVNFGNRPFYYHLTELVKPIYEKYTKRLEKPIGYPNKTGATETIKVIFQYMNHRCFTNTAKELLKYHDNSVTYKDEQFDFNRELYELVLNKNYIVVYNKVLEFFPDIKERAPTMYLAILCGKYYHMALLACQSSPKDGNEEASKNRYLPELISLSRSIVKYFKLHNTDLDTDYQVIDCCGMMKSEWQNFIKELLSLMCFTDIEYFKRFDFLFDFRAKLWNGLSKILNHDAESRLEMLPSKILSTFEYKMNGGDKSAAIGLSHAISLFEGKTGFKFT